MVGLVARMQGGSLVDEIEEQRKRGEIERGREHQRRVRTRIIVAVAGLVFLALATVAAAVIIERIRIEDRIDQVEVHLAAATPEELDAAAEAMARNLASAPDDAESLSLLAFVRVHQFAAGSIEASEVEAALAAADAADAVSLAAGLYAGLTADFDQARRSYEAALAADSGARVEKNDLAWLRGITALGQPYEAELVTDALAQVQAALESDDAWVPNRRLAAALMYRSGDADGALAAVKTAREAYPNHLGLAVDEALYHAATRQEISGVLGATEQLLVTPGLTPREAAYAKLARGMALLHEGGDEAEKVLDDAWASLPAWDNHARDMMLEVQLCAGRSDLTKPRLEEISFGPVADGVYAAWIDTIDGNTPRALKSLADLPQDHPRVAHLQALALVEQRRWAEAKQWLDYVGDRPGPPRPDLEVARARAQVHTADAKAALELLEKLSDEHPRTHRVWTALAEAHLATDNEKGVKKTVARALERETAPAEASWISAERHRKRSEEHPKAAADALAAYERAAEINGHVARYEAALGVYLTELGREDDAEKKLRAVADADALDSEAVLTLADIVSNRAFRDKAPVSDEVEVWLKRSAELGAAVWRQDLSWARYELAQAKPETVLAAQARAERVLETEPRNIEARVIHAQALIGQELYAAARSSLERGIRRTLKRLDGPLYMMEARVEMARGKKRPAASLAFKAWRKMVKQPASPAELLEVAPFVANLWLDISQPRAAKTVGRELTQRIPYSPEAWIFRGETEFASDGNNEGCQAADEAEKLDPKHPGVIALRGDCQVRKFDFESARKTYAKAIEAAKGTPEVRVYQRKLKRLQ